MPKAKSSVSKIRVENLTLDTEVGILTVNTTGEVIFENDYPEPASPERWIAAMEKVQKIVNMIEVA
jgi:hypothetical protein